MLNKSTNCGGYHYVFSISCPYLSTMVKSDYITPVYGELQWKQHVLELIGLLVSVAKATTSRRSISCLSFLGSSNV